MDGWARRSIPWKHLLGKFERPCQFATPGSYPTSGDLILMHSRTTASLLHSDPTHERRPSDDHELDLTTLRHLTLSITTKFHPTPSSTLNAPSNPNTLEILNPTFNIQPYNS